MPEPDAGQSQYAFPRLSLAPFVHEYAPKETVRVDYTSLVDGFADWALLCPPRHESLWLVFVHGHGSAGDQLFVREDIRERLLFPALERGLGLLMVNLRGNAWMGPAAAEDLLALIKFIRGDYGAKKLIFPSGSMGASSNLIFARMYPEEVAGVVALCPATDLASYWAWCKEKASPITLEIASAIQESYGGVPSERPALYEVHSALFGADRLRMPLFLAHGTADDIIPVEQSRRLAERLATKPTFTYVEQPGGHHDTPLALATEALDQVLSQVETG